MAYMTLLVSELATDLPSLIAVPLFIQLCCPRLSIDWGLSFSKPVLNSYEFYVWIKGEAWRGRYPMDQYSNNAGQWGNYWNPNKKQKSIKLQIE